MGAGMSEPPVEVYTPSAAAGDIAQCASGHDVYRVVLSIMPDSLISSSSFEAIGDQEKPAPGLPIPVCGRCGDPWLLPGLKGYRMVRVRKANA